MPKPIFFFGASFNPPTLAHQAIVEHLLKIHPQAQILLAPVFRHRFSAKADLADYTHRLEMTRLAFPGLFVSEIEKTVIQAHPTQDIGTVDVLEYMKSHPEDFEGDVKHISLVLGGDAYQDLLCGKWKSVDKILESVDQVYVFERQEKALISNEKVTIIVDESISDISSTKIRQDANLAKECLNPLVFEYIQKHGLYW